MKSFEKKIKNYTDYIQKNEVREEAILKTVNISKEIVILQENHLISYMEFLYQQSHFIKKKWWVLQGSILVLLGWLLKDSNNSLYTQRIMAIGASVFVISIIPELWKNRKTSSIEIEGTAFYSLRQIYSARVVLFAMVDLVMVTTFFLFTCCTVQISVEVFMVNFLIPFTVSCCICFHFLCSQKGETEYMALILCAVWLIIWTFILTDNLIYSVITFPIWCVGLLFAFIYLIYCIRKSQINCEQSWEVSNSWD